MSTDLLWWRSSAPTTGSTQLSRVVDTALHYDSDPTVSPALGSSKEGWSETGLSRESWCGAASG